MGACMIVAPALRNANFTSFLRVCCGRYLTLIAEGEISPSWDDPLSDVDTEAVLQRERERNGVCPSMR